MGRDLVPYGLPLEKSVHDAWARGRVPVWNADVSGGRPLAGNPNAGVFYPLRPVLALVPFPVAARLTPVFHWILAGWGMFALLAALSASREARWIGAATYAFSGVMVSMVFYQPFQAGAALQPWALWALVRPNVSVRRRAVGLGIAYGLILLGGDPVLAAIALLAAGTWIVFESAGSHRRDAAAALGGGLLLAALLAAPQLTATALLVPETQRAVSGLNLAETLTFTLSPWRLMELAVPYPFGETWNLDPARNWGREVLRSYFATLYCGAFALLALAVGRGTRGSRFAAGLAAAAAILACAGVLVPDSARALASPLPIRYPEKAVVALAFALAVQAGLGFDRIAQAPRRAARLALGAAALLAAFAAAAAVAPAAARVLPSLLRASETAGGEAQAQLPAALAEAGLLWAATFGALALLDRAPGGSRRRMAAAAILAAAPILATRRIALTGPDASVLAPTAFARAVARRDPEGAFRSVDASRYRAPSPIERAALGSDPDRTAYYRRSWYFHTPSLWDRGTVFNSDLDAGDLSRVESLRRVSSYAAGDPSGAPLFESVSLRFAIRYRDQEPLPGFARFGGDALQDWDEAPAALPDVRLAARWREAPEAVAALTMLPTLVPGEVVLETGRAGGGEARDGTVEVLERSPERMVIATSSPSPSWLFVLRSFWSHRDVRVDGRRVQTVPAQLAFTALEVPPGRRIVEWREEIPGIRFSVFGPLLFVLAAVLLLRRPVEVTESA